MKLRITKLSFSVFLNTRDRIDANKGRIYTYAYVYVALVIIEIGDLGLSFRRAAFRPPAPVTVSRTFLGRYSGCWRAETCSFCFHSDKPFVLLNFNQNSYALAKALVKALVKSCI